MFYDLFFVIVATADGEAAVTCDYLAVCIGFVDIVVTSGLDLRTRVCEAGSVRCGCSGLCSGLGTGSSGCLGSGGTVRSGCGCCAAYRCFLGVSTRTGSL